MCVCVGGGRGMGEGEEKVHDGLNVAAELISNACIVILLSIERQKGPPPLSHTHTLLLIP